MKQNAPMLCGYLSDWGWHGITPQAAACLTHINYSFALVVDGAVSDAHWSHAADLDAVIKAFPNLSFILSIGGWGAGGFSEAASTGEGRRRFAETAVDVLRRHGFSGLDIDWEYPCRSDAGIASSPDDRKNFTLLLQTLREALDAEESVTGKHLLLTVAVGSGAYFARDMECDKLNGILDYVNLMTYDMAAPDCVTHHCSLYPSDAYTCGWSADQAVKAYTAAGISRDKLIIGGAFYGHSYEVQAEMPLGQTENFKKVHNIDYTRILRDCTEENGYHRYYDDAAHAPYLYNGTRIIVYDDAQSLSEKVKYVMEYGLAGLMFWEFNGDRTGTLVRVLRDTADMYKDK